MAVSRTTVSRRNRTSGPQYGNYPNYDPLPPQHCARAVSAGDPRRVARPYSQDRYSQDSTARRLISQAPAYDHQQPEPRYPVDLPPLPRFSAAQSPHDDWPGSPTPTQSYQPRDPFPLPPQHLPPAPSFDPPAYADHGSHQNYQDQHPAQNFQQGYQQDFQPERPSFDPPPSFLTADRPPPFMQPSFAEPQAPVYPAAPEAGAMPAPHDDEFYDDAPRPKRRKGLLTVAAVLALAVVGTASAVGYRSLFGGPGKSSPPPVIRANAEPNKVAPPQSAAAATDPSASKFNYDRFADRGKDEQVVKREETPIDQRELQPLHRAARRGAGRAGGELAVQPHRHDRHRQSAERDRRAAPRPHRSDQAGCERYGLEYAAGFRPIAAAAAVAAGQSSAPATRPADPPARAAAPPPQPKAEPRTTLEPRTRSRRATRRRRPPMRRCRSAPRRAIRSCRCRRPRRCAICRRRPPRRAATAGECCSGPAAPAPRASAGGRFHVQVASQKSEADAQASYRSIQSRYSGVLGGQPHAVRRADLGAKGVYYRAMVGPFGSREEAVQLCSSLKSAGGDCVVQAN